MKALTISSLILSLFAFSGCQTTEQFVPVEYSSVIGVENKSKNEIYSKARQWFSHHFVSGESVVDYEDKTEGTIIGNGITNIGTTALGMVKEEIEFQIRVDTKDGRFRTETKITKHYNVDSQNGRYEASWVTPERKLKAEAAVERTVASLKSYVTDRTSKSNTDW